MNKKRLIEIFSAGCPACKEAVQMVNRLACSSCKVMVLDMHDPAVAKRAKRLGIRSVPAIVIDGQPAACCAGRGPEENSLRSAGIGRIIS